MNNKLEPNPKRDWQVMLIIFGILFILILIGYFMLDRRVNSKLDQASKETPPAVPNLNEKKLAAVVELINQRAATLEALLSTPQKFTDPGK